MWIGVNIAYAVPFLIDNIQVRSYRSNNGIHKHCLPCSDAYDDREAGGGGYSTTASTEEIAINQQRKNIT